MLDLKQTLCDIVKAIVDDPSSISITESEENGTVNLELSVAPDQSPVEEWGLCLRHRRCM